MIKYLFIVVTLAVILSCQQGKKQEQISEPVQSVTIDSVKLAMILNELSGKYNELLEFKEKKDFLESGFGIGGPYNSWLKDVQEMRDKYDTELLNSKKGFLFGDLELLGYEYVSSKGTETDYTKFCHKSFTDAIQ